ncbi:MAG TPA: ATP-binding protein [Alphaproteobacteria bacterium]|nr:ATP-binding protein [Alphaproteobacteria bacterium]
MKRVVSIMQLPLPLRVLLLAAVAIPLLIFAGLAGFEQVQARHRAEARTLQGLSLAHEHAAQALRSHDLVLRRLAEDLSGIPLDLIDFSVGFERYLQDMAEGFGDIVALHVSDATGRVLAGSRQTPHDLGVAGRDFFQAHADGGGTPFVSPAFRDPASGAEVFAVSRRLSGEAGGIVHMLVRTDALLGFWDRLATEPGDVAVMLSRDGGPVAHHIRDAGRPPPDPKALAAAAQAAPVTAPAQAALIGGGSHLMALRRVAEAGVVVGFGVDTDTVRAGWLEAVGLYGAVLGAAMAALTLLAAAVATRQQALAGTLARLRAEEARRQEAEETLGRAQKLEAVGQLTSGVAHDFNNLLTAAASSIALAARRATDPAQIRSLEGARRALNRGADLTRQMLAFARRQKLVPQPTDVTAVALGVVGLMRGTLGGLHRLDTRIPIQPVWAMADSAQVEAMLVNLAINGRDAMPEGGALTLAIAHRQVEAGTALGEELAPGRYVVLSVGDTGTGMTDAVKAKALEPFFTTKGPGKGTGLGLSMVYGSAREMGGTITIDSAPGAGTTVSIYLREAEAPPAPAAEARPAAAERGGASIILVDDDAMVREALNAELIAMGHTVVAAEGGPQALALLDQGFRPDLVVTDYAMPGMTGMALREAVKARHPGLPTLLLTGYADPDVLADLPEGEVMRKPLAEGALEARIAEILSRAPQGPPAAS